MIKPHGEKLVNLVKVDGERETLLEKANNLYSIIIDDRFVFDCEMVAIGGFSPLKGFMGKDDVMNVVDNMHLKNGLLWSIPVVLPNNDESIENGNEIALKDKNDRIIAIMKVDEKFDLDLGYYCEKVYRTSEMEHPGVKAMHDYGNKFISGEIVLLNRPIRENIEESYYLDPAQTREEFERRGWNSIVAFQTRNPIHRAHEYLIKCALESVDGALIHPLVGTTKSDDIPADTRMRCYEILIENYFNKDKTMLSVLPAAMRYAGPREAIHHMIIRKNYGCSHMIVGRDHAGVGDYYGTYEAQELVAQYVKELEIIPVKFEHAFFCSDCGNLASAKTCPHGKESHVHLSGTKVREMLKDGQRPPMQFSRKEVADILIDWAIKKVELENIQ